MTVELHLPVGVSGIEVEEHDVRDAQTAFLSGTMDAAQRSLVDACLSWFCLHSLRSDHATPMERGR